MELDYSDSTLFLVESENTSEILPTNAGFIYRRRVGIPRNFSY